MAPTTFAVLLPVKIDDLAALSSVQSQRLTALKKTLVSCIRVRVYLGLDEVARGTSAAAELRGIFHSDGIEAQTIYFDEKDQGKICEYWRSLARSAFADKCDFYVLLGDDIEMHSAHWMEEVVEIFKDIGVDLSLTEAQFGFGCVAIRDNQAPGFPTFPVLHRYHMEHNGGNIFGDQFINQDADPFIFATYRRFGAHRFTRFASLTNHVGGAELPGLQAYVLPRYDRKHVMWSEDMLDNQVARLRKTTGVPTISTVDVVIPTYRVNQKFIERILALKCGLANVYFIVIVDDPSADTQWLREIELARSDVRVRVNTVNLGASGSRNVGLNECNGEFVLFLDDDVIPNPTIIDAYMRAVQEDTGKNFDGFVGYSELPSQDSIFPTAVHFSGVSFFWRAAKCLEVLPWGVTANLFIRRAKCPRFDLKFIKTGGGEDIDFCLKLKRQPLRAVPDAKIEHPWWDNGSRCYRHFYNWSFSDGELVELYPKLTYHAWPDFMETTALVMVTSLALHGPLVGMLGMLGVALVDCLWDLRETALDFAQEPQCRGLKRLVAGIEASFIKKVSMSGRLYGHYSRRSFLKHFCRRFDWFCGHVPDIPRQEVARSAKRFASYVAVLSLAWAMLQ